MRNKTSVVSQRGGPSGPLRLPTEEPLSACLRCADWSYGCEGIMSAGDDDERPDCFEPDPGESCDQHITEEKKPQSCPVCYSLSIVGSGWMGPYQVLGCLECGNEWAAMGDEE